MYKYMSISDKVFRGSVGEDEVWVDGVPSG